MRTRNSLLAAASAALLATAAAGAAHAASLFASGSTFQVQATNSPDTYTDTVNLTPGTQSLDGGAVNLTISEVAGSGSSEWLVFDYTTASGGPLSSGGEDWEVLQTGLDASTAVTLSAAYISFAGGGTPTSSIFGGYSVGSDPVPGGSGAGFVDSSINAPLGSGPLPGLGAFIDPWSYLGDTGINYADVNGYEEALLFTPTSPVPEPSTWALSLIGFGVLGAALRVRRRSFAAA